MQTYRLVGAVRYAERWQSGLRFDVLEVGVSDQLCADVDRRRRGLVWRHEDVADGQAGIKVGSLHREVGHEGEDDGLFLFFALSQGSQKFDKFDDLANVFVGLCQI